MYYPHLRRAAKAPECPHPSELRFVCMRNGTRYQAKKAMRLNDLAAIPLHIPAPAMRPREPTSNESAKGSTRSIFANAPKEIHIVSPFGFSLDILLLGCMRYLLLCSVVRVLVVRVRLVLS